MRFNGEIPRDFIQTGTEGFRNQAGYDSVLDALGANKPRAAQRSTPTGEGSGFWLFALIGIVFTAIFSLFGNSGQAAPRGDEDRTREGGQ